MRSEAGPPRKVVRVGAVLEIVGPLGGTASRSAGARWTWHGLRVPTTDGHGARRLPALRLQVLVSGVPHERVAPVASRGTTATSCCRRSRRETAGNSPSVSQTARSQRESSSLRRIRVPPCDIRSYGLAVVSAFAGSRGVGWLVGARHGGTAAPRHVGTAARRSSLLVRPPSLGLISMPHPEQTRVRRQVAGRPW